MRTSIMRQAGRVYSVARLHRRPCRWASTSFSAVSAAEQQQHLPPPPPISSRFDRRLSVLRVDRHGEVVQEETSIKELLLTTDMHIRDVIALSPDNPIRSTRLTPSILPRGGVIVVVLFPLRLVISRDRVLAFDPQDPTVRLMVDELAHSLQVKQPLDVARVYHAGLGGEPNTFELIVLEQVLRSVSQSFSRISELLGLIVETTLAALTEKGGSEQELPKLWPLKDGLAVAQQSIKEIMDMLASLLASDEDMLGLLLTERAALRASERLDPARHGEVELLLENYHRTLLLTSQQIGILRQRVQSAQEVFSLNVDLYRNRVGLLQLRTNLLLTVLSTSLATCTTIAGFFGMNVINGLETSPNAFALITGGSFALGAAVFATASAAARGQSRAHLQEDLSNMQAYQSLFKHIRSTSVALYRTALDPNDPELGRSKAFRAYFKDLLSSVRQGEVSWRELDLIIDIVTKSADTLRQAQRRDETATEEEVYRRLFESMSAQPHPAGDISPSPPELIKPLEASAAASPAAAAAKKAGTPPANDSGKPQ